MSWDDLDEEILALFGEAAHARGHTKNVAGQEASRKRGFDFGELSSSRGLDLRTSKKAKAAEQREFKLLYLRKWYREALQDERKRGNIKQAQLRAKARFRAKVKAEPELQEAIRVYMRAWRAKNRERERSTKREWTRQNAERLNSERREKRAAERAEGKPARPRAPMTPEQRERARVRKREWEAANRERLRSAQRARWNANLEENKRKKAEAFQRRYHADLEASRAKGRASYHASKTKKAKAA